MKGEIKKTIKVGEMKRRINLINEVKCLYSGNYKTLIQKNLNIMTQTGGKLNYAH